MDPRTGPEHKQYARCCRRHWLWSIHGNGPLRTSPIRTHLTGVCIVSQSPADPLLLLLRTLTRRRLARPMGRRRHIAQPAVNLSRSSRRKLTRSALALQHEGTARERATRGSRPAVRNVVRVRRAGQLHSTLQYPLSTTAPAAGRPATAARRVGACCRAPARR